MRAGAPLADSAPRPTSLVSTDGARFHYGQWRAAGGEKASAARNAPEPGQPTEAVGMPGDSS